MDPDFKFSSQSFEAGVPFWFFCKKSEGDKSCEYLLVEIARVQDQLRDVKFKAPMIPVPKGIENLWGLEMAIPEAGTYEVVAGEYRNQFVIKPSSTLSFGVEFGFVASAVFAVLLILFVWMKRKSNPYKKLS